MRRNVLTAGFVACAMTAGWPGSLFGSAPTAGAPLQSAERHDSEQKGTSTWLWDGMRGPMTLPLRPTRIDSGPNGPCETVDAGNVY